ncbi:MAG: HNH endonuclease, partial [Mycobacteriaceae bacterium]|nr:HNH endonuclease [Mycobacteriaceae bacterium]
MFEDVLAIDPAADERALIARIDALERLKSAAAAAQARAAAAFASARRADAKAVHEMPHTLAALQSGALSEWRATLIVRESACLSLADRRTLDAELCADARRLIGLGDGRIAAEARAIAYRLDPRAVVDRAVRAEGERTVTIRPAPDCMTYLTALLPMAQGVSVYAALTRAADGCGDGRARGQVMADTLIERVTGRAASVATPIGVHLVLSDETLL